MTEAKTALIAGAGGLTGAFCLQLLLQHPAYKTIIAVVRKPLAVQHPKLQQIAVDFDNLQTLPAADDVFCCLGTTIKKAGSQANFRKVDYGYVVGVAKAALASGAKRFLLVSSMGASATSGIFYSRVKGETEDAVMQLPYDAVHIFRPSLLLGNRQEHRLGESMAMTAFKLVGFVMVGPLAKYRGIPASDVAKAMVAVAQQNSRGNRIYLSDEVQQIASSVTD